MLAAVVIGYSVGIVPLSVIAVKLNLHGLLPDAALDLLEIVYWPLQATASQSIWAFVLLAAYVDFWQSLL